jgi:hypothetical protein
MGAGWFFRSKQWTYPLCLSFKLYPHHLFFSVSSVPPR